MSDTRKTVSITCGGCNGTGKSFFSSYSVKALCRNCKGTGYITTYVALSR